MKKLEYNDKETKKNYLAIVNNHPAIEEIINFELCYDDVKPKILQVLCDLQGACIVISKKNEIYNLSIDYLRKKIEFGNVARDDKTIYDNHLEHIFSPIGYEYTNNKRTIFRKRVINYENNYFMTINEDNKKYTLELNGGNAKFYIDILTVKLLNHDGDIKNIREFLTIVSSMIDLSYFSIKLTDELGNLIKIDYGALIDYVEFRDTEKESQRIFMKNSEFLIERRIKEKYNDADDITPFMKRIGVYNGKEKR